MNYKESVCNLVNIRVKVDVREKIGGLVILDNVEKMMNWKKKSNKISVENKNKPITDKLGWVNTDVLYSFLGIYILGLLAYYPDKYYLTKGGYTVNEVGYDKKLYSKNHLVNTYSENKDLNSDPFLKRYIELYFSIGNVIPIWPGGNSHRGTTGIYDIPEIYFNKHSKWTKALKIIYSNAELDLVLETDVFFNVVKGYGYKCSNSLLNFKNIKELLASIGQEKYSRDIRIFVYQKYLQRIIGIIKTRETLIEEWIERYNKIE